jgi:hypothetical protein
MFQQQNGMRGFCCWGRPPKRKQLSAPELSLSFAPYAEVHRSKQDPESGRETIQDHRERQNFAFAILPPAFDVVQECQAQTAFGKNDVGR